MKILYDGYIYSSQVNGGISRYFTNLISRISGDISPILTTVVDLQERGHSIPNVRKIYYKRFGFKPGRLSYAIEPYFFRCIETFLKYSIFHPTYYSLLSQQLISKRKVPTVITIYDMIHEISSNGTPDKTIEEKRHAILSSDLVFCISENTKKDLLERYKLPEEKIRVTHLASDFPHHSQLEENFIAPDIPFFLYIGKRSPRKNFSLLLSAFHKVSQKHKDIYLCVAGSPLSREEIIIMNDLHLTQKVISFTYPNDFQLTHLYQNALAFIYPSLYEGFGIPPLEAMACGTPVITSNVSSIPEVVGDAGLLFNPLDEDELIDRLLFILENPLERDKLIQKGVHQASLFSWEKTAKQTLEGYQFIGHRVSM